MSLIIQEVTNQSTFNVSQIPQMSKANENDSVTLISNQHGSFLDLFNAMQGNVKDFDWE